MGWCDKEEVRRCGCVKVCHADIRHLPQSYLRRYGDTEISGIYRKVRCVGHRTALLFRLHVRATILVKVYHPVNSRAKNEPGKVHVRKCSAHKLDARCSLGVRSGLADGWLKRTRASRPEATLAPHEDFFENSHPGLRVPTTRSLSHHDDPCRSPPGGHS